MDIFVIAAYEDGSTEPAYFWDGATGTQDLAKAKQLLTFREARMEAGSVQSYSPDHEIRVMEATTTIVLKPAIPPIVSSTPPVTPPAAPVDSSVSSVEKAA